MFAKVKSSLVGLAKLSLAAAIIYWFYSSGKLDFKQLKFLLNPQVMLICILIMIVNIALGSERWRGILLMQGFKMNSLQTLRLTLIGAFFNFVIPGGVGGDVVKSYYVAKENPQARLRSVITIAMDRLLGLFSMLLMAVMMLAYDFSAVREQRELGLIFQSLVFVFLAFCAVWAVVFSRRIFESKLIHRVFNRVPLGKKLIPLYEAFSEYRHHKSSFFKAIFLSFVAQVVLVGFFVYIGSVIGLADVSLHTYFFVVPIGFMINAIPITPAGVGVGQMAFYFLFNVALGSETQLGIVSITAFQIVSFVIGLFGAILYISGGRMPSLRSSLPSSST